MDIPIWNILILENRETEYRNLERMFAGITSHHCHLMRESVPQKALETIAEKQFDAVVLSDFLAISTLDFANTSENTPCPAPVIFVSDQQDHSFLSSHSLFGGQLQRNALTPALLEYAIQFAVWHKQAEGSLENRVESRTHELKQKLSDLLVEVDSHKRENLEEFHKAKERQEAIMKDLRSAQDTVLRAADFAKQATIEARASASRLEAILNSLTDAVIVYNEENIVQMANAFAVVMFGFDPVRMHLSTILRRLMITDPDGRKIDQSTLPFSRAEHGEMVLNVSIHVKNPRGRKYAVILSTLPLYVGRTFSGVVAVWNDVSERQRLLEGIRESEDRFNVALANAPITVFTMDHELRYNWIYHPPYGLSADEMVGKRDDEIFPPSSVEEVIKLKRDALETGAITRQEIRQVFSNTESIFDLNIQPLRDPAGKIVGITGAALDITLLRRLEAEQIKYAARMEVQSQLTRHREQERSQIARELHEGSVQHLIATSYALAEAINTQSSDARLEKILWAQEALQKNIRDLRTFCNDLRPPVLAPFGLEKTIRSHIETFKDRNPDIKVSLALQKDGKSIPEDTRVVLFRVYQELLNNISKHAQATQVSISLSFDENKVFLGVMDNGVGFTEPDNWVDIARRGHLGLLGIRDRVETIGGQMEIKTNVGAGTEVQIAVPLGPQ